LKSLKGVDEIIFLDTGSKDATPDIAIRCGAKVFYDVWRDDFAAARNKALDYATGDYVLSIDCDEYLLTDIDAIRATIGKKTVYGVKVKTNNSTSVQTRLFKRIDNLYWVGECHERLSKGMDVITDIEIESTNESYSASHDPDRNVRILRNVLKNNQNKPRELYYMGIELYSRGIYDQAIYYLLEAIELYPENPSRAEVHVQVARCYIGLDRPRRAIQQLHEATRLNPDMKAGWELLYAVTEKDIYKQIATIATNKNTAIIWNS